MKTLTSLSRRIAFKVLALSATFLGGRKWLGRVFAQGGEAIFESDWHRLPDRVWLGEHVWANPMENWCLKSGAVECLNGGNDRSIHLLTHQLVDEAGSFEVSVELERIERDQQDAGAGIRIGIRSELNEYRSNCFAKGRVSQGVLAGIRDGHLVLGDREQPLRHKGSGRFRLDLRGHKRVLTLRAFDRDGTPLGTIDFRADQGSLLGNLALVNNFKTGRKETTGARFRFRHWRVRGSAFEVHPDRVFGPILWSMYTLSDSRSVEGNVLKMSALTGPLGESDRHDIDLLVLREGRWLSLGSEFLDTDSWTATFRVTHWNAQESVPYKLVYHQRLAGKGEMRYERRGLIRANPNGRPLRLGALTCQKDYGFPYEPVALNLLRLDPDLLFFAGDQIYEDHGGYGLIREPAESAILNYLRKYYMFGWAFGEAMRDRPTVCIADDHDVFQGNIWGEGGKAMTAGSTSSKGGYREPARMVNVVHKTCVSHHPDFYDPSPCEQGISVYYGDLVYGNVSFAILGDRQFKSGPEHVDTGAGRQDHVSDPKVDMAKLDKEGLSLLGERQEAFLRHWGEDWRGHSMKVLLSQTVFAGLATHHGRFDGYLRADLDSGGWPQTPRNRAIEILKKGMPLHVNGDQHLTSLAQYGVTSQRDGCWSFCVPAISAGYPRWWRPDEVGITATNRPVHGRENTGEYLDSFGNKVYVYAVGNPQVGRLKNRYELAHQKGSGFGFIAIDPVQRTYTVESFRFLVDVRTGDEANQFPGWPVTIFQSENQGANQLG